MFSYYQPYTYIPWNNYNQFFKYGKAIACPDPDDCDFYGFYEKFNLGFKPADTKREYLNLLQNKPQNLIVTPRELISFLKSKKFNLDNSTIESFIKSIKGDKNTIYSFKYSILADKLTFNEFTELIARLGCSLRLFDQRKDNICCIDPPMRWCAWCEGQYCAVQCPQ